MQWKMKAAAQTAIAALPAPVSSATYYWAQRLCGGLRRSDPTSRLLAGIETWKRVKQQGVDPRGKVFFEVGTGTTPMVPLAYWLMGAHRTVTVDLHRHLRQTLLLEELEYVDANRASVAALFGDLLDLRRWDGLRWMVRSRGFSLGAFLDACAIEYRGPADAADTGLPDGSVDVHSSYTVFEHIPAAVLTRILAESTRIVGERGVFVHLVDYSDHFSHSDQAISAINFLRYSDQTWARYADNRYMYMNRLRHDDVLSLIRAAGQVVVDVAPTVDERARALLESGRLTLDARFRDKPVSVLAIRDAWIVSKKAQR
jgi:SAM-dependent methyltransferase